MLESPGDLGNLAPTEQHSVATNLLFGLENVLRGLSKALHNGSATFTSSAGTGKYLGPPFGFSSAHSGLIPFIASLEPSYQSLCLKF